MIGSRHLLVVSSFFVLAICLVVFDYPDNKLRVIQCDVGQGDSILIQRAFTQVLVDGGPGDRVLDCLRSNMPFWDRNIELIVLTHAHADHFNGLTEVIKRYQVDLLVTSGHPSNIQQYQNFVDTVENHQVNIQWASQGTMIRINDMMLDFIWPMEIYTHHSGPFNPSESIKRDQVLVVAAPDRNPNDYSLTFRFDYHNFSAYFTGDIGKPEELSLVYGDLLRPAYLLKVAHHGSKYSTSQEFLDQVQPQVAFIGVGRRNSFGHPHRETIEILDRNSVPTWRTDLHGQIVLTTDGYGVSTKSDFKHLN